MLTVGVSVAIFSGLLALIFKKIKFTKYFSLFLNAIALGFCIRTWYIFRLYDNSILLMLLISLASLIYLWFFYVLLFIPFFDKHCDLFMLFFIIASFIGYILLIIFTKTTWLSTFGFYMIVEIAFIIGLCMQTKSLDELMSTMLICSFSVFIVAVIIAILMLGGDGFDLDFDFGFSGSGKTTSPKKQKIEA